MTLQEIEKLREAVDKAPLKIRKNLTPQMQSGASQEERRRRIRRTAN
jgi:hypothetical protein